MNTTAWKLAMLILQLVTILAGVLLGVWIFQTVAG